LLLQKNWTKVNDFHWKIQGYLLLPTRIFIDQNLSSPLRRFIFL